MLLFRDLPIACGLEPFTNSRRIGLRHQRILSKIADALSELQRGYELLLQSLTADLPWFDVAWMTAIRDVCVATRADLSFGGAHPEVKFSPPVFVIKYGESIWIGALAAFLAIKASDIWQDDDVTLGGGLTQIAESF